MTIQQKDALTNKIMVYITIAFGGTILWYVVFSLLKSSLKNMGYVVLLACAVLCVILGCFLWSKRHSLKTQNMKSYVRTSFISALFCLFMCCPFIFSLSNIQSKLPSIPYLTDTMTDLTIHFNPAPHFLYQLSRDRRPQPRPPKAAHR